MDQIDDEQVYQDPEAHKSKVKYYLTCQAIFSGILTILESYNLYQHIVNAHYFQLVMSIIYVAVYVVVLVMSVKYRREELSYYNTDHFKRSIKYAHYMNILIIGVNLSIMCRYGWYFYQAWQLTAATQKSKQLKAAMMILFGIVVSLFGLLSIPFAVLICTYKSVQEAVEYFNHDSGAQSFT